MKAFSNNTHFSVLAPLPTSHSTRLIYYIVMTEEIKKDHILIRDGSVIVRLIHSEDESPDGRSIEFYDVRTGVRLRKIFPPLQDVELERGCHVTPEAACVLMKSSFRENDDSSEVSKVVTILEARQRKLDGVVADSILDQARFISNMLRDFVDVADHCSKEERLWLSQQILSTVRKISGRELTEIQEIVDWFRKIGPRK